MICLGETLQTIGKIIIPISPQSVFDDLRLFYTREGKKGAR